MEQEGRKTEGTDPRRTMDSQEHRREYSSISARSAKPEDRQSNAVVELVKSDRESGTQPCAGRKKERTMKDLQGSERRQKETGSFFGQFCTYGPIDMDYHGVMEVWKRILDGSTVGQHGRQDQHLSVSRRQGCRRARLE
jgi:hypothetical protein